MENMLLNLSWDLGSFITNATKTADLWITGAVTLGGIILIGIGVYKLINKLVKGQQSQTSWFTIILMIIIGGALGVPGGFAFVKEISSGGQQTIKDLGGNTTLLPAIRSFIPFF